MLVIVSDLHLSDGTIGTTLPSGAFRIFAERIRELAVSASWRRDGSYRPIDRIDVLLLGDVLDAIRSTQWSTGDVRPWGDSSSPEFLERVTRITTDALDNNERSLAVLRGLAAAGGVCVPPALRTGRPAVEAEGEPVPLHIHYMVGNHDWFYHLPSSTFDPLRGKIIERMGLASTPSQPFAHDMTENEELLSVMRRHKVTARHGDLHDPFNFDGDRDASSLGDMIVIELINRFAAEVESESAGDLPIATLAGLREIDNVRPLLLIPVWIDGLLERTCSFPSLRKGVKRVWDQLAEEFLSHEFVRDRDTWSPFDLVDGLQNTLKFSKRLSIGWASSIMNWANSIRGGSGKSYYHHALAEQDFRNRRSKSIVYGHTHVAESVSLDASYAEGRVHNQEYFNSGTWRRIHRPTELAPSEHEFIAHDVMTYLVFFQADERKGRPYETWSGTLGHDPTDATVHRIDPGISRHAHRQSVSPPDLLSHGPHFTSPVGKPGIVPTRRIR